MTFPEPRTHQMFKTTVFGRKTVLELADVDGEASTAYGVKTRMFGMTVAKRQTFIIGPDGKIAKHYEKVKPAEHAKEVLADLTAMVTP